MVSADFFRTDPDRPPERGSHRFARFLPQIPANPALYCLEVLPVLRLTGLVETLPVTPRKRRSDGVESRQRARRIGSADRSRAAAPVRQPLRRANLGGQPGLAGQADR